MSICPNKGSKEWKDLVEGLRPEHGDNAERVASLVFHRTGDIPKLSEAQRIIKEARNPVKVAGRAIKEHFEDAYDSMKKAFYPEGRGQIADKTATLLREQLGIAGIQKERALRTLDADIRKLHEQDGIWARALDRFAAVGRTAADVFFRGQSRKDNVNFMQWVDTDIAPSDLTIKPEHAIIAKVGRDIENRKVKAVQDLGTGKLDEVREDHFAHMWTDASRRAFSQAIKEAFQKKIGGEETDITKWTPEQKQWVKDRGESIRAGNGAGDAEDRTNLFFSKRPWLKEPASFKRRVFDDVKMGMDFGLEPISYNPLDIWAIEWSSMDKYIASHRVTQALAENGLARIVKVGDIAPSNMTPMDNGFVNQGKEGIGRWYVEKTAGQVIKNYLSKGLFNKVLFRDYMSVASMLNQFQLGTFSAFHGGFTSMDTMIAHNALGFKALVKGLAGDSEQLKIAGKYFTSAPAQVVKNVMTGNVVVKSLAGQDAPTWANKASEWMEMAGATTMQDRRFQTNATDVFAKAVQERRPIAAIASAPFAFVEQAARPILEWLVPRQKIGVFTEMMNRWTLDNPNATNEETVKQCQQAWNRVDSRLGEVVYDRLFIDNTAKNIVQGLVRAPGWTGGTILEIGGGFKDLGKYMYDLKANPKNAQFTDRAAYTVALITTTALANAVLTALFTGEKPDEHDLMAFRTGDKDEHGNPVRFMLPTYMKDIYALSHDLGRTLTNKFHPMVSVLAELTRNSDYYGTEIRHEGDSLLEQVFDMGKYTIKAFQPFWSRGVQKERERGASALQQALPFVGVMPAPEQMTETPAQKLAYGMRSERTQTQEQFQRGQIRKQVEAQAEKSGPSAVDEAVASGKIGRQTGRDIKRQMTQKPIVRASSSLDLDRMIEVWDKANDDEKALLMPIMRKRMSSYTDRHSEEDVEEMRKKMKDRGF